jgi:hypothetical protein
MPNRSRATGRHLSTHLGRETSSPVASALVPTRHSTSCGRDRRRSCERSPRWQTASRTAYRIAKPEGYRLRRGRRCRGRPTCDPENESEASPLGWQCGHVDRARFRPFGRTPFGADAHDGEASRGRKGDPTPDARGHDARRVNQEPDGRPSHNITIGGTRWPAIAHQQHRIPLGIDHGTSDLRALDQLPDVPLQKEPDPVYLWGNCLPDAVRRRYSLSKTPVVARSSKRH